MWVVSDFGLQNPETLQCQNASSCYDLSHEKRSILEIKK